MDELGIFLWSNMNAYNPRPLKPLSATDEPKMVSMMPRIKLVDDFVDLDELDDLETLEIEEFKSKDNIENCLTVSGLPNSRWVSLINLKLIKMRNKVKIGSFSHN